MNSANAVVGCSRLIRKLMKNTMPSVTSISTIGMKPPNTIWPNGVRPVTVPPLTWIAAPPAA